MAQWESFTSRLKYPWFTHFGSGMVSLLSIITIGLNVIVYVSYFHVWGNVLKDVEKLYPGVIDLCFFQTTLPTLIPIEVWLLFTVYFLAIGGYLEIVSKVMRINPKNPIITASAYQLTSMIFTFVNVGYFNFHQSIARAILKCKGDIIHVDILGKFDDSFALYWGVTNNGTDDYGNVSINKPMLQYEIIG